MRNSASILTAAKDFVINGGEYYNAGGNMFITQTYTQSKCRKDHNNPTDHDEPIKGIIKNMPVLTSADIPPQRQIYKCLGYRIYSAQAFGKAVAVKLYQGRRAQERCLEAAKFNQEVMHPNVLHMIGVSPRKFGPPFLVFHGDFEGDVECVIALALRTNLKQSMLLGLQTVIGLASGLDYLGTLDYPFSSTGLDHFVVLNRNGNIAISFDPEVLREKGEAHELPALPDHADTGLNIFHGLCERTFNAACKAHYKHQKSREDESQFEELDHFASQTRGNTESDPTGGNSQSASKPPARGHRRELVWNPLSTKTASLDDVSCQFQEYLDGYLLSSGFVFTRRRGRYTQRTAHRCRGYSRVEITLSTDVTRSTIVSHLTPNPHEICPVCNEVVNDAEIFNCMCGNGDDESMPTLRCLSGFEWHHQACANVLAQNFVCNRCQLWDSVGIYHWDWGF